MTAQRPGTPRLTTAQAAARLGVKPQTLYAYVSRGVISSERGDEGSTFDALEVEALSDSRGARARRASAVAGSTTRGQEPAHRPAEPGRPMMVIDSPITLLTGDDLYFRGRRATDLAREGGFERAIEILWQTGADPAHLTPDRQVVSRARAAGDLLGPSARLIDRLALTVQIAASYDPFRDDLDPVAVFAAARRLLAELVAALPLRGEPAAPEAPLAHHLWPRLSADAPSGDELRLLDGALILMMDHDLATSTLAARAAASARANPYASLSAALGAVDSAQHGAASTAAVSLLRESLESGGPERALAARIRADRGLPGFGHVIYRERDPRAEFVFEALGRLPRFRVAAAGAARLSAIVRSRLPRPANVDLALAAFAVGGGFPDDAGQVIFAVARTAGWIAHVVDEYAQVPLRMRPESRYVGPAPSHDPATA
ncbi:citrate synthase [Frondihabitans australicus]|uniref:citrate synthase (unknown stereospecificity) n=1 Tax=Frondihabitans australicus TaxID=386892 RepID=A0A495IIF3_9MICO|nr:citrate synthase [Frondihabitans australicus]RKR75764.1 citrate synthase [Frondihabitans australicus]